MAEASEAVMDSRGLESRDLEMRELEMRDMEVPPGGRLPNVINTAGRRAGRHGAQNPSEGCT
ncbi:hypothetical protein GCM10010187_45300 [Actinomadura coerulea]|nr:hypothetical protein GCM10010187_45300 [Actinomadura coerulea]